MSSRANVICYYKCLLFYSVLASFFVGYVSGASFGRHGRNRRESDTSGIIINNFQKLNSVSIINNKFIF